MSKQKQNTFNKSKETEKDLEEVVEVTEEKEESNRDEEGFVTNKVPFEDLPVPKVKEIVKEPTKDLVQSMIDKKAMERIRRMS